jgi:hypothetical protein
MSQLVLFETALGYGLFEVNGYEEIQQKVNTCNISLKNFKTQYSILKKYRKLFL